MTEALRRPYPSRRTAPSRRAELLLSALLLGACSGTADIGTEVASIGIGALVGGVTGNPLIGFAAVPANP